MRDVATSRNSQAPGQPSIGSVNNTSGSPDVSGSAEAYSSVTVYDENNNAIGSGSADGSGNFDIGISIGSGSHTLAATATDAAGNTSQASSEKGLIIGTGGDETLNGSPGSDAINGRGGSDTLAGHGGSDNFELIQTDFGHQSILDFDPSTNTMSFSRSIFQDFADISNHMTQSGSDVVIAADANNDVTLHNVQLSQLHQSDFVLV